MQKEKERQNKLNRRFAISIVAMPSDVIMQHKLAERPLISSIEISCRIPKNTHGVIRERTNERWTSASSDPIPIIASGEARRSIAPGAISGRDRANYSRTRSRISPVFLTFNEPDIFPARLEAHVDIGILSLSHENSELRRELRKYNFFFLNIFRREKCGSYIYLCDIIFRICLHTHIYETSNTKLH